MTPACKSATLPFPCRPRAPASALTSDGRVRRRFALYLPIKTTAFLAVHGNVGQARSSSLARDEKAYTVRAATKRGCGAAPD